MSQPPTWRRAWRRCVVILCAVGLITGCAGAPPLQVDTPALDAVRDPGAGSVIYVIRRGWHVDIGLPVARLGGGLASIASQWPGATFVLFGFGDRRYLMSQQKGSCSGLAALWPGPGLILVTAVRGELAKAFGDGEVLVLPVEAGQERRAQAYIRDSLRTRDEGHDPEPVAAGPYDGSFYYAANAIYSGTRTCNTWAAEVLEAAGLPIGSAGIVLAGQVWRRARRCAVFTPASAATGAVPCPSPAR